MRERERERQKKREREREMDRDCSKIKQRKKHVIKNNKKTKQ